MKRILLFSLLSWALIACTKDDELATLAVTPDTPIVFSAAATEVFTLEVTTNQCDWYAVSDQSWCRIIPSGARLTVTAIPNAQNTSPAPATITIRAGSAAPVTITVTQLGSGGGGGDDAMLVVTPADPIQFSAEARETFVLNVETNQGPWDAISDQPWCRVIPGGTKIVINALPNGLNTPPAPATITITSGNAAPVTISVTQLAWGYVYMPDNIFHDEMIFRFDTNYDGKLSFAEAAAATIMDLNGLHVRDLTGIEAFVNITAIAFSGNTMLQTLDLSHNTHLTEIMGVGSSITSINLYGLTSLEILYINNSYNLHTIDVSQCPNLRIIYSGSCALTNSLDVSHNPKLTLLVCSNNNLTSLNLNGATMLDALYCDNNKLTTMDVSHNALLTIIFASFNQITSINLNGASALTDLYLNSNKLITLDISHNPELLHAYCDINQLTSVNLNGATGLTDLGISDNKLTSVDVSQNLNLSYLNCMANPNLTTLYMLTGQTIPVFFKDTPPTNIVIIP